jgi:Flp pilus assembly protein TadG
MPMKLVAGDVTVIVTPREHAGPADGKGQRGIQESRMRQLRGGAPSCAGGEHRSERGSLTLMLAVLFIALLALAGVVIDGGAKLAAAENATSIAQEAARAGAGIVSKTTAYSRGQFVISQGAAIVAARQFLASSGYSGTVSPVGNNSIRVSVRITKPTKVLSIISIDSMTVTGTATAQLVSGVTGPGQ